MKEFFDRAIDKLEASTSSPFEWITAIIDVLLIAVLLYLLFVFLKKHNCSRLIRIVIPALIIAVILGSKELGLNLVGSIMQAGVVIVVIALVLLFPQEMRRSLWKLSSPKAESEAFSTGYECSDDELSTAIGEIVRATQNMAKKDVGALIVIAPEQIPYNVLESGTKLDALLTSPLLESIFNTKAPLHDGAVFIRGNRIVAAGCFLPLTQSTDLDKELGTRHRAAIGITEVNNVMAIIVSEETGIISIALGGEIHRYYDSTMLTDKLEQVYGLKATVSNDKKKIRKRKAK